MDSNNLYYYLAFSHFLGIGPIKFASLKNYFKDEKKAYDAPIKELNKILGLKTTEKFAGFRTRFDPVKKMNELKQKEISVIPLNHKLYPDSLKNIPDYRKK